MDTGDQYQSYSNTSDPDFIPLRSGTSSDDDFNSPAVSSDFARFEISSLECTSSDEDKRGKLRTDKKTEDNKRVWDKKHYCFYCGKPNLTNSDIKNVAYAFSFPTGSNERKVLLEQLRNKGDFKYNAEVLKKGKRQLVTWKQPTYKASIKDF